MLLNRTEHTITLKDNSFYVLLCPSNGTLKPHSCTSCTQECIGQCPLQPLCIFQPLTMPGSQRNRASVDSRRSSKDMLLMPCGGPLYRRLQAPRLKPSTPALSCNQRQLHYLLTNSVSAPGTHR